MSSATAVATPVSLLRRSAVESRTGLSRSEIYRRMKEGSFPKPVALGPGAVAWPSTAVDQWVADRIAQGTRQ